MKQLKNFNIYLRGPEEIVTCPECGSRTEWEELPQGGDAEPQLHSCLNGCLVFVSEIDLDDEDLQGGEIS